MILNNKSHTTTKKKIVQHARATGAHGKKREKRDIHQPVTRMTMHFAFLFLIQQYLQTYIVSNIENGEMKMPASIGVIFFQHTNMRCITTMSEREYSSVQSLLPFEDI